MIHYISRLPEASRLGFPRRVAVLGSTGSIGASALKVVAAHPARFQVEALAAGRNVELLARQAAQFHPAHVAVQDEDAAQRLKPLLAGLTPLPEIHVGPQGYAVLAALPHANFVISAQVGAAGLAATVAAVRAGKIICLANKESLVLAGESIRALCAHSGACILPVDSEHHAIFQALAGRAPATVSRLVLTASGGPFRGRSRAQLAEVTVEQALRHPNWSMGAKITIDSATCMNKGLEIIEACHLYGVQHDKVDVLVHPESIVHSLVEFADASLMAHLGAPDMRTAIAGCLAWPDCIDAGVSRIDLARLARLNFEAPDPDNFPCLKLARLALDMGGMAPVALNAANEIAVELFLAGQLPFTAIPELIEMTMMACSTPDEAIRAAGEQLDPVDKKAIDTTLECIAATDAAARAHARATAPRLTRNTAITA